MDHPRAVVVVLVLALLVISGCGSRAVPYVVKDDSGRPVLSLEVREADQNDLFDALYQAIQRQDITQCRAIGRVIAAEWSEDPIALIQAQRASIWCRFLADPETPTASTDLEIEWAYVAQLDAVLDQLSGLPAQLRNEALLIQRMIDLRPANREAFQAAIRFLRVAVARPGQASGTPAIEALSNRLSEWVKDAGLNRNAIPQLQDWRTP